MKTVQKEHPRLRWVTLNSSEVIVNTGVDIIEGLNQTPKTLPCRYFYDDRGSELFEQVCDLPEYYPTRTEQTILEAYAQDIAQLTAWCELVELGSGSSRKTRLLLDAYSQLDDHLHYYPIDVSEAILKTTAISLLRQYPMLRLWGLAGTYEQALTQLSHTGLERRMLIFLGSTLGNLDEGECDRFLDLIQQTLQPGEFLLLGIDLQKSIDLLEAAYNDAQGVTAAFNLNILNHLNHQFEGNFDLNQFTHLAFYNSVDHQIEMHLRSLKAQTAILQGLEYQVEFQAGETIRTEISRKFHLSSLTATLEQHALSPLHIWTDPQAWFALLLCQRQCTAHDCP
ncbi:MAG: L-histidine N(alpha)-methyltransferase [Acaryochloris sp. RU_4_1]|nr:L-histidine N(alpha)-methyltransferase [Acaryochloris sp. RU_4_1]NJR56333.1 L-histidine N(alpha)-methyltransferase [Acaryochloris sp. CRU_2_0]